MILEAAVGVALVLVGWRLVGFAMQWVERLAEPDDPISPPTGPERLARQRRARWRALVPYALPWAAWGPMLGVVDRPAVMALLLVVGLVAGMLGAFQASEWRVTGGLFLFAMQSIVQLALLFYFAGLAADSRIDPQAEAQRATVVELRRVGRAWWEWSQTARPSEHGGRETDAALLLADRAVGWPALRGMSSGAPRLIDAGEYPLLDPSELRAALSGTELESVSFVDGWGRPLEVRGWLDPRDPSLPRFLVRSAGADGRFEDLYRAGSFPAERVGEDIVWADGAFLREPEPALPLE